MGLPRQVVHTGALVLWCGLFLNSKHLLRLLRLRAERMFTNYFWSRASVHTSSKSAPSNLNIHNILRVKACPGLIPDQI